MAVLNDEQAMLRDMAREWAANESPFTAWRALRDSETGAGFDPQAWQAMAGMGWAGIMVPEDHGGSDFGWMSAGLVVEELGKVLAASPIVGVTIAAWAITHGEDEDAKARHLPTLASGETIAALAVDEGPRHAPQKIDAKVEDGRLTGTKGFVADAAEAGIFIVAAADGLWLVEKGEGVSVDARVLADRRSHGEVVFDGAPAIRLGDAEMAEQLLDRARILTACEMLGMAQHLFDTTLDYLKQRVQFNQVLATFQALQHRMADLFAEIASMRAAVEGGLEALDSGRRVPQAACIAKARANDVLNLMSREAIQLHGGIGMTDEYPVGDYLKRARVLENRWGSSAFLRDRFAGLEGY